MGFITTECLHGLHRSYRRSSSLRMFWHQEGLACVLSPRGDGNVQKAFVSICTSGQNLCDASWTHWFIFFIYRHTHCSTRNRYWCPSPHHTSHFIRARNNFLVCSYFFIVGGIGLITMQLTGKTEDTYVKRQSALSSLKDNEKKWNKLDGEKSPVIYINIININNDSLWYYPSWLLFIPQCHIRRVMLVCSCVSAVAFALSFSPSLSLNHRSTHCTLVCEHQLHL